MKKDMYEAPMVQVIIMEVQGVIAMSGGDDDFDEGHDMD